MELLPLVTGAVGGIGSWFATAFIAEPLRQFYGMRREIVQAILDSENVVAPRNERGDITKNFTDEDKVRLRDTQLKMRQLSTQMLSLAFTQHLVVKWVKWLHYDPVEAGHSLIALSHNIAVFGNERSRSRKKVLAALRTEYLID